ncbi:MAG: tRNA(Ile)-lysidine synthase [Phycisphaerae bacterium]|nr:tRNA(Ile)-lysidine synthase [Phycisphaerae bacterium]
MRMGRFLRQLHRAATEQSLIAPGDGVLLAVSGGPDSMALLHGMAGVSQAYAMGLRLVVAHLNHQTRGEASDGDEAFVIEQAGRLGLPVVTRRVDVPARTGSDGGGFELAARVARYDFFAQAAREHDCVAVATGHHADDNAETILHRILRGTGPRGLAGIPASRPLAAGALLADGRAIRLIRPLLSFRRRLLARVLEVNAIPSRTDASNLASEPTRNWIRNELMPLLGVVANPGVVGALLRLGELSGWVDQYIGETARRMLGTLVVDRTDVELSLNARGLTGKRLILQAELIRQAIISQGSGEAEIGLRHLKAVMRLAAQDADGKQVHLPGKLVAERRGPLLVLRRGGEEDPQFRLQAECEGSLAVNWPGRTELPLRRMALVVSTEQNRPGLLEEFRATKGPREELIDAERVRPPVIVRHWQAGDRFWPLGAPGTKKVSDFMTDRKVPMHERTLTCLLCDQLGPIWVMGQRIDERVRVHGLTQTVARLSLEDFDR